MSTRDAYLRTLLAGCVVLQSLAPSVAPADPIFGRLGRLVHEATYYGVEPTTCEVGAIEELAENIDWLEHHIDKYGSVVAKQPDIWGEARLTKHRDEYERMMFGELNQFRATINASISQGDSAFLAQAIAISNAAAGAVSVPEVTNSNAIAVGAATATLRPVDATASTNFQRFGIVANATPANPAVSLEPTIYLDEMSRYLNHLHELRRINEGDDTSDSPGYALNLVRIPVSILPGKLTREGFGAEVTVTCTPVLSDDLMPTTFQNLVVNDVVDMLRLPVTRVAESIEFRQAQIKKSKEYQEALDKQFAALQQASCELCRLQDEIALLKKGAAIAAQNPGTEEGIKTQVNEVRGVISVLDIERLSSEGQNFAETVATLSMSSTASNWTQADETQVKIALETARQSFEIFAHDQTAKVSASNAELDRAREKIESIKTSLAGTLSTVETHVQMPTNPTSRARQARHPVPPSEMLEVFGKGEFKLMGDVFADSYFGHDTRWSGCSQCKDGSGNAQECRVHILDVERWLDAQTAAAYELLAEPSHVGLFAKLASPGSGLANQLSSGHIKTEQAGPDSPSVAHYRRYFFQELHRHHGAATNLLETVDATDCLTFSGDMVSEVFTADSEAGAGTSIEALAWAIVVEAALLNDRLNKDIRKLAEAKGVYELQTDRDLWFFLPDTVMTPAAGREGLQSEYQLAADMFQRYVRARWPIHVFAVDPREQDQNVADVSNRKRELQFALALGFSTGKIGVNSLTQYSRELDTQVETISLNRTIIGFGHGNDTFGWRFQPRVQALDVPGTLGVLRETFCGASRDYDLKHRQLEAGQRECVAVVLMPSFIPYADFDIRTNWYKLTNPKNSALTMKDTVWLSRAVTAMQNSRAQCSQCAHLYREGEVARMMKRIDQLDHELPLQSMRALVPYENTLGGFEMFNTGVTDLAPELIGWHGAPGIDLDPTKCGCYQGCQAINAECTNAETCAGLNAQLAALGTTLATLNAQNGLADDPLPPCNGPGTTLFLLGKNFSVHDTKVIAGGVCIPHVRLVSREIMQVTIPSCVNTVELCENGVKNQYVAVYVATPYGVTSHLHVPVTNQAPRAEVAAAKKLIEEQVAAAKKQIEEAVTAQVKKTFDERKIPHREISVAPEGTKKRLAVLAERPSPATVSLFLAEGDIPTIRGVITHNSDPRMTGKKIRMYGVVFADGKFQGPLVEITSKPIESDAPLGALGEKAIAWVGLEKQLALFATPSALEAAKGNLTCTIVYYVEIVGENFKTRVLEELPVDIKLMTNVPATAAAAPATAGAMYEQLPEQKSVEEQVPAGPSVTPTPVSSEVPSDCNCGPRFTDWSPWTHQEAAPSPFRLAQFTTPGADQGDALEDVTLAVRENARVLAELSERVNALSNTTFVRTGAATEPQSTAPATVQAQPTVVNVQLSPVMPAAAECEDGCGHDHPLLQQMHTHSMECWRNLRDKIPCY